MTTDSKLPAISSATGDNYIAGFFQYTTGDFLQADTSPILGSQTADTFVVHGLVGGLTSGGGGEFASSFLAAGVGSLADGFEMTGGSSAAFAFNVTEHAMFGGVNSLLGGEESSLKARRRRRLRICSTIACTPGRVAALKIKLTPWPKRLGALGEMRPAYSTHKLNTNKQAAASTGRTTATHCFRLKTPKRQ